MYTVHNVMYVMYLYKKELLYLHIQILTEKEALSSKVHSIHFYGETERKSVVLCCESKSTLHPPPRARLCLRLRHMSRHRRLERRPVTLHTPSIRSISLSGTQFSHFPRKWHHSLVIVVIVICHRAYRVCDVWWCVAEPFITCWSAPV